MAGSVSVLLDGVKKPVKVPLDKSVGNVKEALVAAAKILGFTEFDPAVVTPVVNGDDAALDGPVSDGDEVTSTTNVANGAS